MDTESTEAPWEDTDVHHQAHDPETATEEQGSSRKTVAFTSDVPARARSGEPNPASGWAASGTASRTPLGDRLRELVSADPDALAAVYFDALAAVKWDKGLGVVPDHAVRQRAADAIANRAEGMPAARVEHAGTVGIAALLAGDARDVV